MVRVVLVQPHVFQQFLICSFGFFKLLIRQMMTVISLFLFGIALPIRSHFICDECFHLWCMFLTVNPTEGISNNMNFTLNVLQVWVVLFNVQSSSHDSVYAWSWSSFKSEEFSSIYSFHLLDYLLVFLYLRFSWLVWTHLFTCLYKIVYFNFARMFS